MSIGPFTASENFWAPASASVSITTIGMFSVTTSKTSRATVATTAASAAIEAGVGIGTAQVADVSPSGVVTNAAERVNPVLAS